MAKCLSALALLIVLLHSRYALAELTIEGFSSLKASPGNARIGLFWENEKPVESYQVFRGTTSDFTSTSPIATVSSTRFTDLKVHAGKTYYYRIAARLEDGSVSLSNEVQATPLEALTEPEAFKLWIDPKGQIVLGWKPPRSGRDIFGYIVYRDTKPNVDTEAIPLVVVGGGLFRYVDTKPVKPGHVYYYKIVAYNDGGFGLESKTVQLQAPKHVDKLSEMLSANIQGKVQRSEDSTH